MRVATLLSGGKDSVYATHISRQYGWDVVHAVVIKPKRLSWMFHTENLHLVDRVAQLMGLPLTIRETQGYKEEELRDLKIVLEELDVEGVVSGAVASEYQRTRIEKICHSLGLKSFTPLWHKNQEMLLREMVDAGFRAVIVAVAAEGLGEDWLGREIDKKCLKDLLRVREKYGINVSGEGGEYETLIIDCPLYAQSIEIEKASILWETNRGVLNIESVS